MLSECNYNMNQSFLNSKISNSHTDYVSFFTQIKKWSEKMVNLLKSLKFTENVNTSQ